jgi:hypothetical protein
MNKHGLHRHYDKLEPEERFRLDVLATARGDMEESERLTRTCQRETYAMNHRGYTGRWNGTYEITLRMYIAINNELSKLQMIDASRLLLPYSETLMQNEVSMAYLDGHEAGSNHAWKAAGMEGNPPAWPEPGWEPEEDENDPAMDEDLDRIEGRVREASGVVPEILDRLERDLAARAFSQMEGFSAFCEECVGVAAEKVIAVVLEPVVDRIENLKSLAKRLELEADTETVELIREGLRESWRVVEKRGV